MITKEFKGERISALGFGLMRLPTLANDEGKVDVAEVERMIDRALEGGINYFDTAWGYHRGESERIVGKTLALRSRDRFNLASKFPGYDRDNLRRMHEIFETQLCKCGVEYFDYYLLHCVLDKNADDYLDNETFGLIPYLMEEKARGRIRHLGFSTHSSVAGLADFLDRGGAELDFCQIQLNYIDWTFQDAKAKVDLLNRTGLPIWVMEPLRGGRLATLKPEYVARLNALRPGTSIPAWGFRFLQSIPGVTMTLSGMSTMAQLSENIATFATEEPLNETEMSELLAIADEMVSVGTVPCTACRYCTPNCPQGLDIPELLSMYNEYQFTEGDPSVIRTIKEMDPKEQPSACIGCRSCESACPQGIAIADVMAQLAGLVEQAK